MSSDAEHLTCTKTKKRKKEKEKKQIDFKRVMQNTLQQ